MEGRNAFPTSDEPSIRETNVVHLAWDVMVGIGDPADAAVGLVRARLAVPPRTTRSAGCSYGSRRAAGVLAILALEAGWVVTEVGRQPWIVHNYMTVEQGVDDERRGVDHIPRRCARCTSRSASRSILVMRRMSRRWQAQQDGHRRLRRAVRAAGRRSRRHRGAGRMSTDDRRRVVLRRHRVRGVRGRRLRRRVLGPHCRRCRNAARKPRALIDHSIGPVWEANHVWLIFTLVVLWTGFSVAFQADHADAVRAAHARRARHRPARLELRVPQERGRDEATAALRRDLRELVGARAVLHGRGCGRDRVGSGARRRRGAATGGRAG